MIAVHMDEDRGLGFGECLPIAGHQNLASVDPADASEPCDEMGAGQVHAVQLEIAEARIESR